ncbi:MAG: DUF1156 domain-containing protein [Aggregatilineales bacterium]
MTNSTDKRLIEYYIPIKKIGAYPSRGKIGMLHVWWARRPLVASRAAVSSPTVNSPKSPG